MYSPNSDKKALARDVYRHRQNKRERALLPLIRKQYGSLVGACKLDFLFHHRAKACLPPPHDVWLARHNFGTFLPCSLIIHHIITEYSFVPPFIHSFIIGEISVIGTTVLSLYHSPKNPILLTTKSIDTISFLLKRHS